MIGRTRLGTETKEYFKTAFYSQIVSVLLENEFLKKPISSIIEEQLKDVQKETENLKKEVKLLQERLEKSKKNDDKENKSMEKSEVNINFSLENYSKNNDVLSLCQVGKNNNEQGIVVKRTQDFVETSSVEFSSLKHKEEVKKLEFRKNFIPSKFDNTEKNYLTNFKKGILPLGDIKNDTSEPLLPSFGSDAESKWSSNCDQESHIRSFRKEILTGRDKNALHTTFSKKITLTQPFVRGTDENTTDNLTASFTRKSIFFATYFSLNTTKNQLESYLKGKLGTHVFCEEILPNKKRRPKAEERKYLSFKIVVDYTFGDTLYVPDIWPEGIVVKKFRKFIINI